MSHLEREKNLLEELVKAREAVKQKYNLLKFQKDSVEQALAETFKPIVDPLQKLVEKKKRRKEKKIDSIKNEPDNFSHNNKESVAVEKEEPGSFSLHNDQSFNENYQSFEESTDDQTTNEIKLTASELDKLYGIKRSRNGYLLGKTPIKFEKENIIVKIKNFLELKVCKISSFIKILKTIPFLIIQHIKKFLKKQMFIEQVINLMGK